MKNRNTILAFLVIGIFFLSVNGHVGTVAAQNEVQENFSLSLFTNSGNRLRESYALYIKQAVVPLGINIDVIAKPFGQFVGDLLHLSTGEPWDLAIVGFTGGLMPDFQGIYDTDSFFGCLFYQLCEPEVQEWFLSDTGLNLTEDVDPLILDAVFTLDPIERWDLTDQFAQLFMDQLLYDLPLIKPISEFATWRGFAGENNEGYFPNKGGLIAHSYQGHNFDDAPAARAAPATMWQEDTVAPAAANMLDTYQVADTATGDQSNLIAATMFTFYDNIPYPYLAHQWFQEDLVYNGTFIEAGRHTFIMDNGFTFPATVDVTGAVVAEHALDANDVRMALDYLMHPNSNARGETYQDIVANYSVSTTYTTDDTITIDLNEGFPGLLDYAILGGITPLPDHILGGTLNLANGTSFEIGDNTFNPSLSDEWLLWQTFEGNTYASWWEINEFELDQNFYSFKTRDSQPKANEARSKALYDANTAAGDALFAAANTTGWPAGSDMGYFAPHLSLRDPADSLNFNGVGFGITDAVYKITVDDNARLILFEDGELDQYASSGQGLAIVQEHRANDDYVMANTIFSGSPNFMAFDVKNEHLKYRDVRYAIASMIDLEEMTQINDGFAIPNHSPVTAYHGTVPLAAFKGAGDNGEDLSWYNEYAIPNDFATARDLMRDLGYTVPDSATPKTGVEPPVNTLVETLASSLGADAWIGLSAFAIASVVFVRRKRTL